MQGGKTNRQRGKLPHVIVQERNHVRHTTQVDGLDAPVALLDEPARPPRLGVKVCKDKDTKKVGSESSVRYMQLTGCTKAAEEVRRRCIASICTLGAAEGKQTREYGATRQRKHLHSHTHDATPMLYQSH
jgi:hypothetical protein